MHCECYLQTYLDAAVVFRVLDFDIEQGQSCTYDYLQVQTIFLLTITIYFLKKANTQNRTMTLISFRDFMHHLTKMSFYRQFVSIFPEETFILSLILQLLLRNCNQVTLGNIAEDYCTNFPYDYRLSTFSSFVNLRFITDSAISRPGFWFEVWGRYSVRNSHKDGTILHLMASLRL